MWQRNDFRQSGEHYVRVWWKRCHTISVIHCVSYPPPRIASTSLAPVDILTMDFSRCNHIRMSDWHLNRQLHIHASCNRQSPGANVATYLPCESTKAHLSTLHKVSRASFKQSHLD